MTSTAIQGTVERYVTQPREDGFAILSIATSTGVRARICGRIGNGLSSGQVIEANGKWTTHPRFGRQFLASDLREIVPENGAGLVKWLMQAGISGMSETTAKKLVATFGTRTIQMIAEGNEAARIMLAENFGAAQSAMIANRAEHAFGPILADHGIGPAIRAKIFEIHGLQTAITIAEDPYRLITDVEGIPFATADKMAKESGFDMLSRKRLVAAAIDVLRVAANDGHTAVDVETLAAGISRRTTVHGKLLDALIADIDHPTVIATVVDKDGEQLDGWALANLDRAESRIAECVMDKIETQSLMTVGDSVRYVALAEAELKTTLNVEQRAAAVMALSQSLSIMTGGPGTGKTHTLNVICRAWRLAANDGWVKSLIKLGAPTGKAAQRMKELTGIDAATLHRVLEVNPTGGFVHNELNPIEAGFIAIDEASMKDAALAAAFSRAWGDANVLLIGDPDQLASVGPGRVLGDLIESGVLPVTRLVQIRRQAEGSAIAEGAEAIRQGKMPVMKGNSDFVFIEEEDPQRIADVVAQLHAAYIEDGMDVQVLAPGHQSEVGTIALNERLQADSGNATEGAQAVRIGGGQTAYVGDKVIQTENDNEAHVYNGDSGCVTAIHDKSSANVHLGDRDVAIKGEALRKLGLAYALSVHKSQGSEYEVVIMPLTLAHWSLLRRTLFYTGLTRAKQTCIVIGSRRALRQAIANDDGRSRTTTLMRRLREMQN